MSVRLIAKIPLRHEKIGVLSVRVLPSSLQRGILVNNRQQFSSLKVHSSTSPLWTTSTVNINTVLGNGNHQVRWMNTKPDFQDSELVYEGPMARLISSLKFFSLSSAVLSTVGLPAMMLVKGIDVYSGIHIAMVGTTVAGSVGSTLGLQYIFAPYIYTLEQIPIRQCNYEKEGAKEEVGATTSVDATGDETTSPEQGGFLLKATTRSVLYTKVEHIFDPETDVTGVPGGAIRPFCSFFAKGKPLYIHEQMISDPVLRQNLFIKNATPIKQQKNPDPDDDFF